MFLGSQLLQNIRKNWFKDNIRTINIKIKKGEIIMLFYFLLIAPMLLYINTVSIMKKIKIGEDTSPNTTIGCILIGSIIYSIFAIVG